MSVSRGRPKHTSICRVWRCSGRSSLAGTWKLVPLSRWCPANKKKKKKKKEKETRRELSRQNMEACHNEYQQYTVLFRTLEVQASSDRNDLGWEDKFIGKYLAYSCTTTKPADMGVNIGHKNWAVPTQALRVKLFIVILYLDSAELLRRGSSLLVLGLVYSIYIWRNHIICYRDRRGTKTI